jgi:hypothetical protein
MINEPLYRRTVDILVNAYFNDTLKHGDCFACAVGNIVNYGKPEQTSNWVGVFYTADMKQWIRPDQYEGYAKYEIDSTGYKWQELAKIEYAFESAPRGNSEDEWMFNGLMNVIDVLDDIHQNKDTEATKEVKKRFVKTPA